MKDQENASESTPRERTPFRDLTNTDHGEISQQTKSKSWYARLSDEKKEEYLRKQRIARQKKKGCKTTSRSRYAQFLMRPNKDQCHVHTCQVNTILHKQEIGPHLMT